MSVTSYDLITWLGLAKKIAAASYILFNYTMLINLNCTYVQGQLNNRKLHT